ncbi:PmoA family protein [uncultured Microbacterium sp.]|uniref:Uncharacterized protein n=1 Tax=uncultured Microbacterium sp. TaxID=191216 RepID=A0A1Y5P0R4_9MICO|nr:PmoA family protein [uncultured Microbacterium sp.]SBS72246.1 conserved hypothetical protein [uncultured Microbacterium sp.]
MHFDAEESGRLRLREGDGVLAEYVYEPHDAPLESPRPYALLRTRSGADVTAYRPDDHVWHKGLSLALPVVGPHNFWGGPTYVHGEGYVQLPNNGAQVHRAFVVSDTPVADAVAGLARVDEDLDWIAEDGARVLIERRTLTARPIDADTWALTWRSALRNVSDGPLGFGSPTSKGRENAGYAGIFWRGPVSHTGGDIVAPSGRAGDDTRGEPGPWLAFIAPDRSAGVLMLDAGAEESPWFARSAEYAGLNPAPFFFQETVLPPGETLVLAAALVIGTAEVAALAATVGATLVDELRAAHTPDTPEDPA